MNKIVIFITFFVLIISNTVFAGVKESISDNIQIKDNYNPKRDYFDDSVVLEEFPKIYYYTTIKINKSKERILIITDGINTNKNCIRNLSL